MLLVTVAPLGTRNLPCPSGAAPLQGITLCGYLCELFRVTASSVCGTLPVSYKIVYSHCNEECRATVMNSVVTVS